MQPVPFIAASAEEAVAKIRAHLGPDAVVLNVRRLPQNGLARLWQEPMIEVLAHVPEVEPEAAAPLNDVLAEFREQLREIRSEVQNRSRAAEVATPVATPVAAHAQDRASLEPFTETIRLDCGSWQLSAYLQNAGLLPLNAQKIVDRLQEVHGEQPPESLHEQILLAQKLLAGNWREAAAIRPGTNHVLIGPSGSGKTTCLCKWMTQASLMEGKSARVWRLDGAAANTAEALSVYCDILGTPCERNWPGSPEFNALPADVGFIDLPGVDWRQPLAVKELAGLLKQLGSPQVHLVLNGAYDASILIAQVRAFSSLPVEDLILTHLDEETRWGKLWNLVLGTNFPIRHFSTGQNIPGDFIQASAEKIINAVNPCNKGF